jgi:hypothetical protein
MKSSENITRTAEVVVHVLKNYADDVGVRVSQCLSFSIFDHTLYIEYSKPQFYVTFYELER